MVAPVIWIEAGDATQHPSVHPVASLVTRHPLAQIINSAKAEKPWTHPVSTLSQEATKEKGISSDSSVHFIFYNKYPKICLCKGIEELLKVVFIDAELIVGFDSEVHKESIYNLNYRLLEFELL